MMGHCTSKLERIFRGVAHQRVQRGVQEGHGVDEAVLTPLERNIFLHVVGDDTDLTNLLNPLTLVRVLVLHLFNLGHTNVGDEVVSVVPFQVVKHNRNDLAIWVDTQLNITLVVCSTTVVACADIQKEGNTQT